jgi:hypothetical protein
MNEGSEEVLKVSLVVKSFVLSINIGLLNLFVKIFLTGLG